MYFPGPAKLRVACKTPHPERKDTTVIYSHKTDACRRNLSREEVAKLKKLLFAKPTAWMVDPETAVG